MNLVARENDLAVHNGHYGLGLQYFSLRDGHEVAVEHGKVGKLADFDGAEEVILRAGKKRAGVVELEN